MEVASLRVSVDYCLLENMHVMGRFDSIAPEVDVEELTEDHIKAFLESITRRTEQDGYNPVVIENALKGVRMPLNIEDPEAREFEFMHNIFSRLEGVGYGDFKKENPKVMIQLIQERLYPHTLKAEMGKHVRFQPGLKDRPKSVH